jgi:hypothetical protein
MLGQSLDDDNTTTNHMYEFPLQLCDSPHSQTRHALRSDYDQDPQV